MAADDLDVLPMALRASIRRLGSSPSAEVEWPLADAVSVIDALADAGRLILGTELRDYSDGTFEVAWSSYDGGDVEDSKQNALAALRRANLPGDWVVITW